MQVFVPIFLKGKLFIWIAFASWTVFFTAKTKERLSAISRCFKSMTSFLATFLIVSILMIGPETMVIIFIILLYSLIGLIAGALSMLLYKMASKISNKK